MAHSLRLFFADLITSFDHSVDSREWGYGNEDGTERKKERNCKTTINKGKRPQSKVIWRRNSKVSYWELRTRGSTPFPAILGALRHGWHEGQHDAAACLHKVYIYSSDNHHLPLPMGREWFWKWLRRVRLSLESRSMLRVIRIGRERTYLKYLRYLIDRSSMHEIT